ncbi:hypothetical protein L596_024841 [Steinernema carpocapsae]|uniref:Uncharacterized protein n=1 Tax=Steinernema carpocapsae TaxID=34508 RepID=A0A4U5M5Z1_STECR|nr:hypothetical protein L596_024841 [Steinernema carpocapsae]
MAGTFDPNYQTIAGIIDCFDDKTPAKPTGPPPVAPPREERQKVAGTSDPNYQARTGLKGCFLQGLLRVSPTASSTKRLRSRRHRSQPQWLLWTRRWPKLTTPTTRPCRTSTMKFSVQRRGLSQLPKSLRRCLPRGRHPSFPWNTTGGQFRSELPDAQCRDAGYVQEVKCRCGGNKTCQKRSFYRHTFITNIVGQSIFRRATDLGYPLGNVAPLHQRRFFAGRWLNGRSAFKLFCSSWSARSTRTNIGGAVRSFSLASGILFTGDSKNRLSTPSPGVPFERASLLRTFMQNCKHFLISGVRITTGSDSTNARATQEVKLELAYQKFRLKYTFKAWNSGAHLPCAKEKISPRFENGS